MAGTTITDEAPGSRRPPPAARYGRVAKTLHWIIAAAFALQIGLGWRMDGPIGPQTFAIFQLHKSVGITILLLTILRLAWRVANPVAPLPGLTPVERITARIVHAGFYVLLIGLPLTGWLLVSSSARDIPTVLFGTVPWPHVPGIPGLPAATKATVNAVSTTAHQALVWVAYLAIALHIAGALKHEFIDRDAPPLRMLTARHRRVTVIAALTLVALAFVLGLSIRPPRTIATTRLTAAPEPASAPAAPPAPVPEPAAPAGPEPAPAPSAKTSEAAVPATEAAPEKPVPWIVRKSASSLRFHNDWSQGAVDGSFGRWDAKILFSPDALADSSVTATIDLASVTTNSSTVTQALPGDDWFGFAAHPTATFTGKAFRHLGGDRYEVNGTLDLHGIKRPLRLPFRLTIADKVATMSGTVTIDRTTFGIGQGEWASPDDVPAAVRISIAIKADQRP